MALKLIATFFLNILNVIVTFQVTLHATYLTLSAMTIDRYHAIVNPIQSMNWSFTRSSSY